MRKFFFNLINEIESKEGKIFSLVIQFLILLSIVTFSISTLPDLSDGIILSLEIIELFTVILFSIEYLLRIIFSRNKLKFIFSFFGIIDLISILPFFLNLTIDLRTLRILRFVRIFRILKFARYNKAMKRLFAAFVIAKDE